MVSEGTKAHSVFVPFGVLGPWHVQERMTDSSYNVL